MKLIKPSYEILPQPSGLDGVYKQIEIAGRTCYKSESKGDDPKKFVDRMAKSYHGSMLEHGTVYLKAFLNDLNRANFMMLHNRYFNDKHSKACKFVVNQDGSEMLIVTTNLRVIHENNWFSDLKYLCEPTKKHMKRYTVRFVTDRATANQFVRHRAFSFAQESQRYVNYSKGKFGEEVKFILPCWMDERLLIWDNDFDDLNAFELQFISSMIKSEESYFILLDKGWKPEQARVVLPNATATELVMTGFESDWEHFFNLRAKGTTGRPHPQAMELAVPLMEEMIKK